MPIVIATIDSGQIIFPEDPILTVPLGETNGIQ